MTNGNTVRLEFHSTFEMLDFVQVVSDHLGRLAGLDEEALPLGRTSPCASRSSTRSSTATADDEHKRVHVEFTPLDARRPSGIVIRVRDEGPGFDPETVLRSAGAREPPEGERPRHLPDSQLHGRNGAAARAGGRHGGGDGQARRIAGVRSAERRVTRRSLRASPPDPVFLATAVEIVLQRRRHPAGAARVRISRRQERHHRPRHRGRSRVRADVSRGHRRAFSRSRHARRGAEQRTPRQPSSLRVPLGVRPARRHDQLRARPADLLLVAGARDRRPHRGRRGLRPDARRAVHRRTRGRGVPQRHAAARRRRPPS